MRPLVWGQGVSVRMHPIFSCALADQHRPSPIRVQDPPLGSRLERHVVKPSIIVPALEGSVEFLQLNNALGRPAGRRTARALGRSPRAWPSHGLSAGLELPGNTDNVPRRTEATTRFEALVRAWGQFGYNPLCPHPRVAPDHRSLREGGRAAERVGRSCCGRASRSLRFCRKPNG